MSNENKSKCAIRSKGRRRKRIVITAMTMVLLFSIIPLINLAQTGSRGNLGISDNSCDGPGCHPTPTGSPYYDEFLNLDSLDQPSQILLGDSAKIYLNVSINSTTYAGHLSQITWRCTPKIYLTSPNGTVSISPPSFVEPAFRFPGWSKEYMFTISAIKTGFDTINLEYGILTGHGGKWASGNFSWELEVIRINRPPQLIDGKVSPTVGNEDTDFTFTVTYRDPDRDLPAFIEAIIDEGSSIPMTLLDGNPDTLTSGEFYTVKRQGSILGLGDNHTFRFRANDSEYDATGDIDLHYGPNVSASIPPNTLPEVNLISPAPGMVSGVVNVTGTAMDEDLIDEVGAVEVRVDIEPWRLATGTQQWYADIDMTNYLPGDHVIYVRSSDGKDYSEVSYVTVTVVQAQLLYPAVSITEVIDDNPEFIMLNGTTMAAGGTIPVDSVEVLDLNDTWSPATALGPIGPIGLPTYDIWTWSGSTTEAEAGPQQIAARAWANGVASDPVFVTFMVNRTNNAPFIDFMTPGTSPTMFEGASAEFSVNASDPDGDDLSYKWFFDGIDMGLPDDQPNFNYESDYTSRGLHLVEVMVSDGHPVNGRAYQRWNLTVLKGMTMTDYTDMGDGVLESAEEMTFSVSVYDPEGGDIDFKWYVDGAREPGEFGPEFEFYHESIGENPTYLTIGVVATNQHGITDDMTWTVEVKGVEPQKKVITKVPERKDKEVEGFFLIFMMFIMLMAASAYLVRATSKRKKGTDASQATQVAQVPAPAPSQTYEQPTTPSYTEQQYYQPQTVAPISQEYYQESVPMTQPVSYYDEQPVQTTYEEQYYQPQPTPQQHYPQPQPTYEQPTDQYYEQPYDPRPPPGPPRQEGGY